MYAYDIEHNEVRAAICALECQTEHIGTMTSGIHVYLNREDGQICSEK
jgi:hypothetical protein